MEKKERHNRMEKLAIMGGDPIRDTRISYGHQYIDEKDIEAVVQVLKSDYLTCGPEIEKLEKKLCQITGAKYAVAISSGTAALHAACYAAGIGEGDEVITTPITFAASANCVLYCGGIPVFADINEETFNISPEQIADRITDKTKAVVAVDYTGQAVELDKIRTICDENNIVLIEDGAHSIGTLYNGIPIGRIADMTTFSFHPVKTVTGGEGGAILTNNEKYYKLLLLFRTHGITRDSAQMSFPPEGDWYYQQIDLGYNYRMTDIQAALVSSQLDKLPMFKKRRREIVEQYNDAFAEISGIILQKEIPESDTARHLYILQLDLDAFNAARREIFEALKAENIWCNVHYIPIYYFEYYQKKGYKKGLCPKAERLYERMITLPLYYSMSEDDVTSVICGVKKVLDHYRKPEKE